MARPDNKNETCYGRIPCSAVLKRREFISAGIAGLASSMTLRISGAQPQGSGLAVRAGMLYTVSGAVIKDGIVLIRDGRIAAVGAGIPIPAGTKTLQAAAVMPAMVDPHSYLGCYYESAEPVDAITPDFQIVDGFDAFDPAIQKTVRAGVTTAAIMPGNGSVLGGQAAILRLGSAADIISRKAGQKISVTADAASPDRNPTSRAGAMDLLVSALRGALSGSAVSSTPQTFTLAGYPSSLSERVSALRPLINGKTRGYFHAPTSDDVELALQVMKQFALKGCVVHASEAYRVAAHLAERKVAAILSPLLQTDSDHTLANAARLSSAGVKVAFCTDSPLTDAVSLRQSAHIAQHYGLSTVESLRAITLSPAEILGVSDRVGSLSVGKEADMILLSGNPLELSSRIEGVVMRGRFLDRKVDANG